MVSVNLTTTTLPLPFPPHKVQVFRQVGLHANDPFVSLTLSVG